MSVVRPRIASCPRLRSRMRPTPSLAHRSQSLPMQAPLLPWVPPWNPPGIGRCGPESSSSVPTWRIRAECATSFAYSSSTNNRRKRATPIAGPSHGLPPRTSSIDLHRSRAKPAGLARSCIASRTNAMPACTPWNCSRQPLGHGAGPSGSRAARRPPRSPEDRYVLVYL